MNPPTHAMIAAACGVNISTVSRALGDNPAISEATRKTIRAKAEAMGWKPNPLVAAYMAHLRSSRKVQYRANLAYVPPFPKARRIDDLPGYHQEHFAGCKEHAAGLGYELEPIWYSEWEGVGSKLSYLLKNRGIPGAILHGVSVVPDVYQNFDWASLAVASWGSCSPSYALHRAAAHYHNDMQLALTKLKELGYKKIALMLSDSQDELSETAFFASFLYSKAFERSEMTYEYVRWSHKTPDDVSKKMLRRWLEKKQPDCIIGEFFVWDTLNEMGWRIPEDVAYASIFWNRGWSKIGGVDQMAQNIGRNTVDLVVGQLVRNERGLPRIPKLLLSQGIWMDGPSCPGLRKSR